MITFFSRLQNIYEENQGILGNQVVYRVKCIETASSPMGSFFPLWKISDPWRQSSYFILVLQQTLPYNARGLKWFLSIAVRGQSANGTKAPLTPTKMSKLLIWDNTILTTYDLNRMYDSVLSCLCAVQSRVSKSNEVFLKRLLAILLL